MYVSVRGRSSVLEIQPSASVGPTYLCDAVTGQGWHPAAAKDDQCLPPLRNLARLGELQRGMDVRDRHGSFSG